MSTRHAILYVFTLDADSVFLYVAIGDTSQTYTGINVIDLLTADVSSRPVGHRYI